MAMKRRLIKNLFGEYEPEPERKALDEPEPSVEQTALFDNTLTEELKRARKIAKDHKDEGGKELFPDKP